MAKEKKNENTNKEDASKNLLGSLLRGYSDTHYNFIETKPITIPSGSLLLDSQIRVPSNSVVKLIGEAQLGKTSQAVLFAANFMTAMPKSKTIYVNAEAKFGEDFKKRTGLKYVESADDWDYGTVFIFHTNIFDTICDTLESMLKQAYDSGEHLCIIIDSMDCLRLKSSLDAKAGDSKKPAGVNFLTKELFRRIGHQLSRYNSMLIAICQFSQTFTMSSYEKEAPKISSGNATHSLNHNATTCLEFCGRYNGDYIKESDSGQQDVAKNKILGVFARIKICKDTSNKTNYTLQIPIKFGVSNVNQIWRSKEVGDAIIMWGLAIKGGAWLTFDPSVVQELKDVGRELKEKVNGVNALYDYLEENPLIMDHFYQKFSKMLSQS